MNALAVLSALLLACAAGFGITVMLLAKREKISIAELGALSWLLGSAFISLALWIAGFFAAGQWLLVTVTLGCVALFTGGIVILQKGRTGVEWPRAWRTRDLLLCGFLALEFGVMLCMAYRTSMAWDGLFAWEWKARLAFFNDGRLPLYYFSNPEWHPDYPLFLSLNETWLYLWLGDADQFWVRILFPAFYIAGALMLYIGCSRLAGNRTAGLVAACLLFFVPGIMAGPGSFNSGYADFPLAVFYLAAAVQLLVFLRNNAPSSMRLFALLAGLLPWIKRDGDILWVCIVLAGVIAAALRKRPAVALAGIAAPGIVMIGEWTIFLNIHHTAKNIDFLQITPAILRQNIGRVIPLTHRMMHEFLDFNRWGLVWAGFAVAVIHLALTKRMKLAAICLFLTGCPLVIVASSYLFSAWADYTRHVDSSLPRLVMQVVPIALLAISAAIADRNPPLKN